MENNEFYKKETDPLYEQVREKIAPRGTRVPYKEYIKERAKHYINVLAPEEELYELQQALTQRINASREAKQYNDVSR